MKWTKEVVLHHIKERQAAGLALNSFSVTLSHEALYGAARRLFGSWQSALQEAGIDPDSVKVDRSTKSPAGTWSPERVISEIRAGAEAGHDLAAHRMQATSTGLVSSAVYYFGSWKKAIEAAGYTYEEVRLTQAWSREKITARLQQLQRDGADLSRRNAEAWDYAFVSAATKIFGGWSEALQVAGVEEQRRTTQWTKDRILQAICEGLSSYDESGLRRAAIREFGSWDAAIQAAGVPERIASAHIACTARQVRESHGLSQAEVSKRMGVSHRIVGQLESGQYTDPRVSLALRMARALDCRVQDLWQLKENTLSVVSSLVE